MIATGTIQAFDQADRTLTLDGGRNFFLDASVDMTLLKTNDTVSITYDEPKGGGRVASAVAKVMPGAPPPPNLLVREPKATKVNTTASLKAK